MDLRKLRHACILAEEGSFARAARRLNLTQPALSRSIQSLEESLALRLFDRLSSGIQLTKDGNRILDHAKAILRLESNLRSEAVQLARGEIGNVAFGVGPMLTPVLGPVLAAVLARCPHLGIRVEIEAIHVLSELLLDDRIDFFIADSSHALTRSELDVTPLHAIPAGFFVRHDHPLATRPNVRLEDLAAYPLSCTALGDRFGSLANAPASMIACEDSSTLKHIVLATDAVLLGMGLTMQPELDQRRIVALPIDILQGGKSQVGVIQRTGRTRSVSATRIIAAFDAELARHG